MTYVLKGYEPRRLFEVFEDICAIPRGSGNEAGIADYLCAFAAKNGLEVYRDGLHNVLIKKPASDGYADHPPVILQGHTDMVCEKLAGVEHDFTREGIKLAVEDGWLKAEGTTLGADDGVAVAIMLALLDEQDVAHPPLECLFTAQEETGMDGAIGFDYSRLAGRAMINLDSEFFHGATVSCAGGATAEMTLTLPQTPAIGGLLTLTLTGLAGGHSGADIHLGRANAARLTARLLIDAAHCAPIRLVSFEAGSKANAIPRECTAVIVTPDPDTVSTQLTALSEEIRRELSQEDRDFDFQIRTSSGPTAACSLDDTRRLLAAVTLSPDGPLAFLPTGTVETSCNCGIVRATGESATLTYMPRSSVASRLDELIDRLGLLAATLGGQMTLRDRHPGWAYAPESRVREAYVAAYRRQFGDEPQIEGIHAGLECGIFSQKMPGLDAVSIGPEAIGIHTPDERLNLASFAAVYLLVKAMLADL